MSYCGSVHEAVWNTHMCTHSPFQTHSAGPRSWRRDYPLPYLSEVGRGPPHGALSPPCLGLPLLPASRCSSALLSRDSSTELVANLSSPCFLSKMLSSTASSPLTSRPLMRWKVCQFDQELYPHWHLCAFHKWKISLSICNLWVFICTLYFLICIHNVILQTLSCLCICFMLTGLKYNLS